MPIICSRNADIADSVEEELVIVHDEMCVMFVSLLNASYEYCGRYYLKNMSPYYF